MKRKKRRAVKAVSAEAGSTDGEESCQRDGDGPRPTHGGEGEGGGSGLSVAPELGQHPGGRRDLGGIGGISTFFLPISISFAGRTSAPGPIRP